MNESAAAKKYIATWLVLRAAGIVNAGGAALVNLPIREARRPAAARTA